MQSRWFRADEGRNLDGSWIRPGGREEAEEWMATRKSEAKKQVQGPLTVQLESLLQVGNALRFFFGAGDDRNRVVHLRALIDGHFVIRIWDRAKRRWDYEIHPRHYFWKLLQDGHLSKGKAAPEPVTQVNAASDEAEPPGE